MAERMSRGQVLACCTWGLGWHLGRPVGCLVVCAQCGLSGELVGKEVWLAAAVMLREAAALIFQLLCIWVNPAVLLYTPRKLTAQRRQHQVIHGDRYEGARPSGGWDDPMIDMVAEYVAYPEAFVSFAVFGKAAPNRNAAIDGHAWLVLFDIFLASGVGAIFGSKGDIHPILAACAACAAGRVYALFLSVRLLPAGAKKVVSDDLWRACVFLYPVQLSYMVFLPDISTATSDASTIVLALVAAAHLLVSVMGLWTIAALVQYTHDKASYERGALRAIFAQEDGNTAPVGDRGFRDFMFTMSAAHLALSTAVFGPPLQKWLGWPEL
eukprot:COSAG04_NODE_684_length_11170_cov_4.232228_8_plen_325_part_00